MRTQTINEVQDGIIEDFCVLNGNLEKVLMHIVNLGLILPAMPEGYRNERNLVKGCHSQVWLAGTKDGQVINFSGDSDTAISKGLLSLLLHIFNGQRTEEILRSELYFIRKSGLERFIGTRRSNGFYAMAEQIRKCAL